jgi:hypothetical protein
MPGSGWWPKTSQPEGDNEFQAGYLKNGLGAF